MNRAQICSQKLVAKLETYARTFAKYGYNLLHHILLHLKPVFCSETPYHRSSVFKLNLGSNDSDSDGIPDDDDACPDDNPLGLDADLDGCTDSAAGLIALIEMLPNDALDETLKNSLIQKVTNANQQANKDNLCAAINILKAFQNAVEAQRGNKISNETADLLIDYAANLITQFLGALSALDEACNQ